jgi:hypothetical protein
MIYRNWSLLSSTVVIWGGVATAGLAGIFLFGGKVLPPPVESSASRAHLCNCLFLSLHLHLFFIVVLDVCDALLVPAFAVVRFEVER